MRPSSAGWLPEQNEHLRRAGHGPLLFVAAQKTGQLVEHARRLAPHLAPGQLRFVDDAYRYQEILISRAEAEGCFGRQTYYCQDVLFKSRVGKLFVLGLPFCVPDKYSGYFNVRKVEPAGYPHLRRLCATLEALNTELFPDALVPSSSRITPPASAARRAARCSTSLPVTIFFPELMHHDDAPPLLRLPCYEPPGLVFEWSRSAWLRHTLLLGATGCGKTSLINEILWQLIHHAAGDPRHKLGLLILDPKGDESVQKVMDYATAAGRANDVLALDGVAPMHYDFFAGLRELRDVDGFARRLLFAASPMSRENAFWEDLRRNLLVAALTVLVSTSERPTFTEAVSFLSGWLLGPGTVAPPVALRLTQFAQVLAAAGVLTPAERLQLQTTQDQVIYWRDLDSRMRGSAQATLLNVLQLLVSARAADYLSERGPTAFDAASAVKDGKLLVASVNALTEPALAALLFRLFKLEFYAAIQARGVFTPAGHRLADLLVDEAQLCLGDGDVEQLATLRSKGGFVVAATQGLSALSELLGSSRRDALLLNFNTTFLFQTSEAETDVYALRRFGWRAGPPRTRIGAIGDLAVAEVQPGKPVLVCPPGTLAQLPPHTCFVALPGLTCLQAVWPAPRFYDPPPTGAPPVVPPSRFAEVRAAVLAGPATANLDIGKRSTPRRRAPTGSCWPPARGRAWARSCWPRRSGRSAARATGRLTWRRSKASSARARRFRRHGIRWRPCPTPGSRPCWPCYTATLTQRRRDGSPTPLPNWAASRAGWTCASAIRCWPRRATPRRTSGPSDRRTGSACSSSGPCIRRSIAHSSPATLRASGISPRTCGSC